MIRRLPMLVVLSIIAIGGSAFSRPTRPASQERATQDHIVHTSALPDYLTVKSC
jgi:hypothetical protein